MDAADIARRVAQARQIVADMNAPNALDDDRVFFLLGQAEFVIRSLVDIIDPDEEMGT